MSAPTSPPYRPAARPVAGPVPRSSVTGSVIFIAVLSSVLTTVATLFVIGRYVPALQPAMVAVLNKAGLPSKSGAVLAKVPKGPKKNAVGMTVPPVEAANSALSLVQTVREQGSDFTSPEVHPNFWNDLLKVEQSATAVANDDGSNPANTAKLAAKFSASLDTAITMASDIAGRSTTRETEDALSQAAQLRDLLTGIREDLP
jgi:flagellar hook-basal body complex protein FliE